MWEFTDGVLDSNTPTATVYSNAKTDWSYATVRRSSLDANANHYIAYVHTDGANTCESSFEQASPFMDITQIDPSNYGPRIIDFNTFTMNGDEWLAMACQDAPTRYSGTNFSVYDITDRELWSMTPEDSGYNFTFRFYNSATYGGTNYEQQGSVCPYVDGDKAYIYVSSAAKGGENDAEAACVICYEMTYTEQTEN